MLILTYGLLHETQELETRAAQNRIKNDEIYKEWLLTMTPLQIKEANIARRKIAKLLGVYRSYPLHDERLVARPRDSWKFFLQEQAGIQAPGVSLVKVIAQISEKWKAMSPEEQEVSCSLPPALTILTKLQRLIGQCANRDTREWDKKTSNDMSRSTVKSTAKSRPRHWD